MFSITTPTQIKDNPLNTSSAKHHWSFSKASRFKDPNPKYFSSYSLAAKFHAILIVLLYHQEKLQLDMEIDLPISKAERKQLTLEHIIH